MKSLSSLILSLNILLLSSCSTAIFSRETECYKKVNKYAKKHWIYKVEEGNDEKIILENEAMNALIFRKEKLDNCLYTLEKEQIISIFGPPQQIDTLSKMEIRINYAIRYGCQEFNSNGTYKSMECDFYSFTFKNDRCVEARLWGVSRSH